MLKMQVLREKFSATVVGGEVISTQSKGLVWVDMQQAYRGEYCSPSTKETIKRDYQTSRMVDVSNPEEMPA